MRGQSKEKNWILGAAGITVGCIGAFTQSWILRGNLNHSYPFKIMSVPPPEYYIAVSTSIASFAPFLAIVAGFTVLIFLRRKKIIAGIIPVIVCPMVYIAGLWYLVSNGPYQDQLYDPVNYDGSTAAMRHQEFFFGGIELLLFSSIVYLIFAGLSIGVFHLLTRGKTNLLVNSADQ